jgi:hypothetical protein
MWTDTDRDETRYDGSEDAPEADSWEPGDPNAYWRRRFFILCGGVVALGLCAWLFPGAHQGRPSAAASASMAALASQQALPPAATGNAWSPSPAPKPSASPRASGGSPKQKLSLAYRPRTSASASGGHTCGSVVLSLTTTQPAYTAAAGQPKFKVYAVSTAQGSCTLRYGAGSVAVMVTRHGQVVWNSTACKPKEAPAVTFTQGVPRVLAMTWDRGATGPAGCAGSLPAGSEGTLDAVAMMTMMNGKSSPVAKFKLASGTSAPAKPKKAQPKKVKSTSSGSSTQYKPRQG